MYMYMNIIMLSDCSPSGLEVYRVNYRMMEIGTRFQASSVMAGGNYCATWTPYCRLDS